MISIQLIYIQNKFEKYYKAIVDDMTYSEDKFIINSII